MKADRKYAKEVLFNLADCDFNYIIFSDLQTKQLINKTQKSKLNKTLVGQRKRTLTLTHSCLICTNIFILKRNNLKRKIRGETKFKKFKLEIFFQSSQRQLSRTPEGGLWGGINKPNIYSCFPKS